VQTAARWLQEAAAAFRTPGQATFLPACLADLATARAIGGAIDAAEQALAELEDLPSRGPSFLLQLGTARTWVVAAHGETRKAWGIALDLAHRAEEQGQHAIAVAALHDVARLGNVRDAATGIARVAANVEGPFATACAAHVEALATGKGRHLEQAAQSFEAIGADLLAAEASAEAASAHRSDGRTASVSACSARASRLLTPCEGARTPALATLSMPLLTPREREIVALLTAGLTSAEAARRLVLSVRTVENHVQNVYGKLGVSSRSELRSVLSGPKEAA
jgi:DNA-binding NarL/FixJ family response regulator